MTEVTFRPALRRAAFACLVLLLGLIFVGCGSAASTDGRTSDPTVSSAESPSVGTPSPAAPSAGGPARIVRTRHAAGRTWDVTIHSPAVGANVPVRLLLPVRYDREPHRRWPVLYLLHGCCDSYLSWTRSTDVEKLTRDSGVLVVMPDGGKVGFYSNWRHGPQWETFHLTELPALLAQHYRAGPRRAIAGVSMGGLGALGYAARHPGSFTVAASFSGIVNTRLSDDESQAYVELVHGQGEDPNGLWGDPSTDQDVWKAHNPDDLAPQLKGTQLFISAGNGHPGPLDPDGATTDRTETAIHAENEAFVKRVRALHLDAQIDLYGDGTHNWVYWQRELHRAWPLFSRSLGL